MPVFRSLLLLLLLLPPAPAFPRENAAVLVAVDSPALVFSPGNWTGDAGRGGKQFRQTWNPGAYFRLTWETRSARPWAKLRLDTSGYPAGFKPPQLAWSLDGVWRSRIPCAPELAMDGLAGSGRHVLEVFVQQSQQEERWGSPGNSGRNVVRLTGIELDPESTPLPAPPVTQWALIVGDSITEGIGATELAPWSHLVGQALQTQGFETCVSACGWSGWIHRGDNPPGDVPGYYLIRNSVDGDGGDYDEAASRWNKIDGNHHSLLDERGRLSGYGATGQEPALILINYGTNDSLHRANSSDTRASMVQCLAALRQAAPQAHIALIIPFGQYMAAELREAVEKHRKSHPDDARVALIDLGPAAARSLAAPKGLLGGLHPNDRGHAHFAARIIPQVLRILTPLPRIP